MDISTILGYLDLVIAVVLGVLAVAGVVVQVAFIMVYVYNRATVDQAALCMNAKIQSTGKMILINLVYTLIAQIIGLHMTAALLLVLTAVATPMFVSINYLQSRLTK